MFHVNTITCCQIMRALNQPTNFFFLKQSLGFLGLYLGSKNILGVQCWGLLAYAYADDKPKTKGFCCPVTPYLQLITG